MRHTHYYQIKAKTHFEEGYKLAKLFKPSALEIYHDTLAKTLPLEKLLIKSKLYLNKTATLFPQYIEILKGYAKGLDVDFHLFWLTFLSEEFNTYPEKCTSCFSSDGMIIGHNEDFYSYFKDRIVIIEKTVGKESTIELYYHNSIGGNTCSINSHGYVQTINDLHHGASHIGVPHNIIARWMSDTKDPSQDYLKMKKIKRSLGYSHTFSNREGEVSNIESTPSQSLFVNVQQPYVHTNHYLSHLSQYEKISGPSNTLDRYKEASRLVGSVTTAQDMMNLLENVSCLVSNKDRSTGTIARMVFDLKRKEVWCWLLRESSKGWVKYPLSFI